MSMIESAFEILDTIVYNDRTFGSKSGNLTQYQWKRSQHRFVGFLEKSQNQGYVYEKCIF